MADGIISTFGNYDFFGKSLPGMVFVIGIIAFLPVGSLPLPKSPNNLLSSVSFLLVVFVLGTLSGEFVHSATNTLENMIAWVGRQIRKSVVEAAESRDLSIRPIEPMVTVRKDSFEGSDDDDTSSIRENAIYRWLYGKYTDIVYLLWPHRKIFFEWVTQPLETPYQDANSSVAGSTFTHEYILEKAIDEYEIADENDIDDLYTVLVSTISRSDYHRAFRFQSRYAFCRSMWIVLSFIWIGCLFIIYPIECLIPNVMHYQSILTSQLSNSAIGLLIFILFVASIEFASASSAYKRYYIEYIFSEVYAYDNLDSSD